MHCSLSTCTSGISVDPISHILLCLHLHRVFAWLHKNWLLVAITRDESARPEV